MVKRAVSNKGLVWNTIGIFAQNAISPLLLVVITRVNGIGASGLFSFAFSIAIIFWLIGMWGGRTYQVSDVKREYSYASYVIVRLMLGAVIAIGAVIFTLANGYDTEKSLVIWILVAFKIVESIADALYGILQVHRLLRNVGRSLFFKAFSSFIAFTLVDIFTHDLVLSIVSVVIVNIVFVLFYDIRLIRLSKIRDVRDARTKKHILQAFLIIRRCFPIFMSSFLVVFSLNIPRYFIDRYAGDQIGYFGILAMPITLVAILISFILQPNVPRLTELYEKRTYGEFNRIFKRLNFIVLGAGAVILIGTIIAGVQILSVIFGIDFGAYELPLIIMVIGGVASAMVSLLINILIVMRTLRVPFYILVLFTILLTVISIPVVKSYGLLGGTALFTIINLLQLAALAINYCIVLPKKYV